MGLIIGKLFSNNSLTLIKSICKTGIFAGTLRFILGHTVADYIYGRPQEPVPVSTVTAPPPPPPVVEEPAPIPVVVEAPAPKSPVGLAPAVPHKCPSCKDTGKFTYIPPKEKGGEPRVFDCKGPKGANGCAYRASKPSSGPATISGGAAAVVKARKVKAVVHHHHVCPSCEDTGKFTYTPPKGKGEPRKYVCKGPKGADGCAYLASLPTESAGGCTECTETPGQFITKHGNIVACRCHKTPTARPAEQKATAEGPTVTTGTKTTGPRSRAGGAAPSSSSAAKPDLTGGGAGGSPPPSPVISGGAAPPPPLPQLVSTLVFPMPSSFQHSQLVGAGLLLSPMGDAPSSRMTSGDAAISAEAESLAKSLCEGVLNGECNGNWGDSVERELTDEEIDEI